MATSQYTPNLHLSAWAESDRPKRADFVSDNNIIDTEFGGHVKNDSIHLSKGEKEKITEPYVSNIYSGSGESSRTISLGFQPKFVLIYKRGVPPVTYSNNVNTVNCAYGFYGHGGTVGISITSSGVIVSESATATNGVKVSLNERGSQYTIVAFK